MHEQARQVRQWRGRRGGAATGSSAITLVLAFLVALLSMENSALAASRNLDVPVGGQRILKLGQTIDRIAIADQTDGRLGGGALAAIGLLCGHAVS